MHIDLKIITFFNLSVADIKQNLQKFGFPVRTLIVKRNKNIMKMLRIL